MSNAHAPVAPVSFAENIEAGNTQAVKDCLRTGGFDVNARWPRGHTPLELACTRAHVEIIQALVEHKAVVDTRNHKNETPLIFCVHTNAPNAPEAVRYLLSQKADPNHQRADGWSPLTIAACSGNASIIESLLQYKADTEQTERAQGASAIWWAAQEGRVEAIRLLATAKADVNKVNNVGVPPLWKASKNGHIEGVKLLIAAGANIISSDVGFSKEVKQILGAANPNPTVMRTELLLEEAAKCHITPKRQLDIRYYLYLNHRLSVMEDSLEKKRKKLSVNVDKLIDSVKNMKLQLNPPSLRLQARACVLTHGESSSAPQESVPLSSSSCTLLPLPAEAAAQLLEATPQQLSPPPAEENSPKFNVL
jgi:ankyrin repeat protein